MKEWVGWIATAVFAASYVFKNARTLMWVQALAASLWIVYGLTIGAAPVVLANVVVAGMALFSAWRRSESG